MAAVTPPTNGTIGTVGGATDLPRVWWAAGVLALCTSGFLTVA